MLAISTPLLGEAESATRSGALDQTPQTTTCPAERIIEAEDSDYGLALLKAVQKEAFYFQEAANLGQKGVVSLCFKVHKKAGLEQVMIERSTAYPLLDGAALYAAGLVAQGASRHEGHSDRDRTLFRPPQDLLGDHDFVWLRVNINFQLLNEAPEEPTPLIELRDGGRINPKVCNVVDPPDRDAKAVSAEWKVELEKYAKAMNKALAKILFYPRFLLNRNVEGKTDLPYMTRPDGSLICASVLRTSGYAALDGAALISLGLVFADSAQPSPAQLISPESEVLNFVMPVNFELN